ncbi:CHAP domain-containing protein [Staphylococcus auricularis]|uniref:CHAP domain-containing protein n=1 Tax=Staphylococcus auricularis TaxID=29379 RepID=A0AAW7ME52_9STAP|nr:CHAP domain-containing protein [Staphylococcus auricularis]MDC6327608.1 CHAP domain-containing protein [Staphylococcus auricularis]MDN4533560.1 CHAP domain-containing protein [Staphylococcus auricularis]
MKKIATATIAIAGIATLAFAHNDADAAENNQGGYNPNDPTSYSYTYTIDQQGNYHYTWQGNWSPDQAYQYNNYDNYNSGYSNYSANTQSYQANSTGGRGAAPTSTTSDRSYQVTTQAAPSSSSNSIANNSGSANNLYTAGQCTYYVFDRTGGKVGSTWGNANNWANAAASEGYTVNNSPKAGAVMQSTAGAYGHVAYVESVNNDGSIRVSEMNFGHGPGVVSSRTISAGEAASYNYIH